MTSLKVKLNPKNSTVNFEWEGEGPWNSLKGVFYGVSDVNYISDEIMEVPERDFVVLYDNLYPIFDEIGTEGISAEIWNLTGRIAEVRESFNNPLEPLDIDSIQNDLLSKGWGEGIEESKIRILKSYQLENVSKMAVLKGAATFSVPGAGKTTEALAYLTLRNNSDHPFLVIAPLNAFGAWDEGLEECLGTSHNIIRLNSNNIESALKNPSNKKFIVSYDQAAREESLFYLQEFFRNNPCPLILDESHRIKNQLSKRYRAVSRLCLHATDKVIMTGTPMPQSQEDLISQFNAIYPEDPIIEPYEAIPRFKPIFVRTPKHKLGLPPMIISDPPIQVEMNPTQALVHKFLKGDIIKEITKHSLTDKSHLRNIGKPILRLLMFLSNPLLIKNHLLDIDEELASSLIEEGNGPKVDLACTMARELVDKGEKVLIWTSFRGNVEIVADLLEDLGSEFIHGGVQVGDENDVYVREGKIKKFKEDINTNIMVANPASAGEGISLHMVCHNAIYIDRTFNAAQYLQSLDRIHRLGLPEDQETNIHLLQLREPTDIFLHNRLEEKIQRMNEFLDSTEIMENPQDWEDESPEYPEMSNSSSSLNNGGLSSEDIYGLEEIFNEEV